MDLLSFDFLLFLPVLTVVYFAVPKKYQWWVLLAGSLFFYGCSGVKNLLFVFITAGSSFLAANRMEGIYKEQKDAIAAAKAAGTLDRETRSRINGLYKKKAQLILTLTLLLNFGLLSYFKYLRFVVSQISRLFTAFGSGPITLSWKIIAPLGISFFTFQTMGYVIDVYWKKIPAEKNFFRMLLFTSFFPQVTQGPISVWSDLSKELFAEHDFTYRNFSWGMMRMIWGFFKKVALANALASYFAHLTDHYAEYAGISALLAAFLYSLQIYADFSGYMDIICGYCEVLGIKLTENFMRPYFSKSVAEYWRRWHITLGYWFKTYLYYPIATAKWNQNIGRIAKKHFGKTVGSTLPASISLVVVWFTTGLWHGASWGYIVWGGLNGVFIIFSLWMEPVYESWKQKLHISDASTAFRVFQVIRTFTLLTLIKILPELGGLRKGLGLWKQIFTNHVIPRTLDELVPCAGQDYIVFTVIIIGGILLFAADMIQRKQPVRQWFTAHVPYVLRVVLMTVLVIVTIWIGSPFLATAGGFMYADF